MSDDLRDLLLARAERAERTDSRPDPHDVVLQVRARVEQRRRTRRNTLAAGGGAGLIAALVAGAVVLPSSGGSPDGRPAGGVTTAPPGAPAGSSEGPPSTPAGAPTLDPSLLASMSAAAAAARSAAAAVASQASAAPSRSLAPVATPAAAAVAVGEVPAGWRYTGREGPTTFYGPDALAPTDTPDFDAVIVVDVHERITPDGPNDLTIGGRAGRYGDTDGVQTVSVIVDATTELDVQVPLAASVTRAQALQIAGSLDLRSAAEKTHG